MTTESEKEQNPKERLNPFQAHWRFSTSGDRLVSGSLNLDKQSPSRSTTTTVSKKEWLLLDAEQPLNLPIPGENKLDLDVELKQQKPQRDQARLKRIVEFRPALLDDERFQVFQKWEGKVTLIENGVFWADLRSLTNMMPDEEVEMALEEVLADDRDLVEVGASFYWSIGNLIKSHGQQIRASEIRFRRVPGWTEKEIAAAEKTVKTRNSNLKLESGKSKA